MKAVCTLVMKILLASILIFLVFSSNVGAFSGEGDGTETNPYKITNVTQLQEMKNDLKAHYILMNDIDASNTEFWNLGAGFEPIGGGQGNRFSGMFDGQGYVIHDLFINRPSRNIVGLFGYLDVESMVKKVGLKNVNINGQVYVGSLVGWSLSNSIADCYATGEVSGYSKVGGLVGFSYGTITNSYGRVAVSGLKNDVGGLVGENSSGTITNSKATGAVSGTSQVGGLVGENSYGMITNSYATGKVSGSSQLGGLVGYTSDGMITDCYAIGAVSGVYSLGGLVGRSNSVMITNSFWDTETSGQISSDGGTGKTTKEMTDIRTYTDTGTNGLDKTWDMVLIQNYVDETWYIDHENDYPRLGWEYVYVSTYYDVTFNVTNSDRDPLEGVKVKLNGMEQATGNDGLTIFEKVPPGSYSYEVSKDGYDTEYGGIKVVDEDITEKVILYLKTPPPVTSAIITPTAANYDLNASADVTTTITWNDASSVTSVEHNGSALTVNSNFTVINNNDDTNGDTATLAIYASFFASQNLDAGDVLELTIEFNVGDSATLTVTVVDSTPPVVTSATIAPTAANYDLNASGDVTITITWNDASSVTSVEHNGSALIVNTDYEVNNNNGDTATLAIYASFFAGQTLDAGDVLVFTINFDVGDSATLTVTVVGEQDEPEKPDKPGRPDQPGKPDEPGKPDDPDQPGKPEKPDKPEKPEKPVKEK